MLVTLDWINVIPRVRHLFNCLLLGFWMCNNSELFSPFQATLTVRCVYFFFFFFWTQWVAFISVCIHTSAFSGPEQKSGKTQQFARKSSPPISGICCAHRVLFQSLLRTVRNSSTKTKVCTEFKVLFVPVATFQTRPKRIARWPHENPV